MKLSIVLPLRNQARLTSLLGSLYDRSSSNYHHFLTVKEFADQFGPTIEDYQKVLDFASANGLELRGTAPANRMILSLTGSVAQVEKAFGIKMRRYQHPSEAREFFSPDREPTIPAEVPIRHIAGLDNYSIPKPLVRRAAAANGSISYIRGSGPSGSYLPGDMRAAYYGGTALTGNGQTVGLLQFDGYDINDVVADFGGAATATSNGTDYVINYAPGSGGSTYSIPVHNVLLDGATGASGQFTSPADDTEEALDIAQAIGMAPGLSQLRVYIGSSDVDILNAMAAENIAKQISISWTWTPPDPYLDDFAFQEFAAQGQSVFVASGDFGAYDIGFPFFYPAEDDFVTAVGGTSLMTTGAGGSWSSETAWSKSGGGASPDYFPLPYWQQDVATSSNQGSTLYRNVPDVAMEADNDNYACNMGVCGGGWGGTSFAAPRWAGYMALVNQAATLAGNETIGFLNPTLYTIGQGTSYADDFHDIAIGSNGYFEESYYAVPGYDLVTGWGSPNTSFLIDTLTRAVSSGFRLSSSAKSLIIAPGDSATTTISVQAVGEFTGSVNLAVPALPRGLSASFDSNPTNGISNLTITVDASTPRGSFLLLINGTSGDATASTSLAVQILAPGFGVSAGGALMNPVWTVPGFANSTLLHVTPLSGFTGAVSYAITSPLPVGVTALIGSSSRFGAGVLTLTADDTAAYAKSVISLSATSGNASAETTAYLRVQPPLFFLGMTGIVTELAPGDSFAARVFNVPVGNFADKVTLSATQVPAGVTVSFDPITIGPGQASTMTVTASPTAALGVSFLTLEGRSDTSVNGAPWTTESIFGYALTLSASPPPNCAITLEPANITVAQNRLANGQVQIADQYGYSGSAYLESIGGPDSTTTYDVNPASSSTAYTITAAQDAAPTIWSDISFGQCGSQQGLIANYITVTPTLQFDVVVPANLIVLPQGGSTMIDLPIKDQNGFSGNVTFSASGLPMGISASFISNTASDDDQLNLQADASVPPGSYFVNVAASNGVQQLVKTIRFQVQTLNTPTVTVTPSLPSITTADALLVTVSVIGSNGNPEPTGTVTLSNGSYTSAATVLSRGSATISIPAGSLRAGSNILTASYKPDSSSASTFNAASGSSSVTVAIPTTTTLTISPNSTSLQAGSSYTVVATVTPASGATVPTGIVVFTIGSATHSMVLNSSGLASYTGNAPTASGSLNLSAAYQGSTEFAPSSSNTLLEDIVTPVAATPTFSVAPGTYTSVQTIAISDSTPGATIHYTTNGSTPTTGSTPYSGPITVATSETIEAIAVATGYTQSAVASAAYTINLTAATPTFSVAPGTYTSVQTIAISDSTPRATIYYTTNGSTPTTGSIPYSGPITVSTSETIEAIAVATSYSQSAVASATYTINLPAATPTFSVAPGTYTSVQTVSISDSTPGATIYYTTNGSNPTTGSTPYSGPITVSTSETIEAVAVAAGYSESAVASAAYTINLPTATPTFSVAPGTYTSVQTVSISDSTPGATIFYTTSGSAPTTGSTPYSGPITVSASETIQAIAVATGYSQSAVASAAYTINPPAATPTFSVAPGTYTSLQTVVISDSTPGATIFYTTNGSAPTTSSTPYSGPITVSASETIQAIAVATGYSESAVASAAYTIELPAKAAPSFTGVSPAYVAASGHAFTITVKGTGFIAGSTVYWSGTALLTQFVTDSQLSAQVPASDIASAGVFVLTVRNAAPDGGTSNQYQFEVDTPESTASGAPSFSTTTATVAAGSTASYPVTVSPSATSVSITCLNLPTGASCSYSSASGTVSVATSSTTAAGNYPITVVFSEMLPGTASAFVVLPVLLLPLAFARRRFAGRGLVWPVCLAAALLLGTTISTGCGGHSTSTTPPPNPTQHVTNSGVVSLTIK